MRKRRYQLAAVGGVAVAIGVALIAPIPALIAALFFAVAALVVTAILRARRERHRSPAFPRVAPGPVGDTAHEKPELEGDSAEEPSPRASSLDRRP